MPFSRVARRAGCACRRSAARRRLPPLASARVGFAAHICLMPATPSPQRASPNRWALQLSQVQPDCPSRGCRSFWPASRRVVARVPLRDVRHRQVAHVRSLRGPPSDPWAARTWSSQPLRSARLVRDQHALVSSGPEYNQRGEAAGSTLRDASSRSIGAWSSSVSH